MKTKRLASFQQTLRWIPWNKRLRLDHLPQPIRSYAGQIVAVALTACFVILLVGLGLYPFERTFELPESLSPIPEPLLIPFSLMLIFLVGLGLLARALYYASYQPGWALPAPTRLLIGLFSTILPLEFLEYSLTITNLWSGATWIQFPLKLQLVFVLLALISGCAAVVCAFMRQPSVARWAARFAMGSYLGMAIAFLMFKLIWDFLARQNDMGPEIIAIVQSPVWRLMNYAMPIVWFTDIIFFWLVITEVKLFSREIGVRVAKYSTRIPWLLIALFTFKGIWLLVGYVNAIRTGTGEPWTASLKDGPLEWLLAFLFAAATGWWLLQRRTPTDPGHLVKGALFLTLGFLLPFILGFLLWIPGSLVLGFGSGTAGVQIGFLSSVLAGIGLGWSILFVALLIPLGVAAQRHAKLRFLAPIALLTGVWSIPFVIQAAAPNSNIAFEYLTYDVALTVALFVLLVREGRRQLHKVHEWIITLILTVSTLMALVESLFFSETTSIGFALLLILPMLYQLFFDSEELNSSGPDQGRRIVRTIGFQAVLMLIVAWALALRLIRPGQTLWEEVATRIFLPPFLLLYLANTITTYQHTLREDEEEPLPA